MKPIRTAVIGTGFMGRVHLDALRRTAGVEIAAVVGRRLESAKRLAADFGVLKAESDYAAALRDRDIDAVHVCTANAVHFQMTKDALLAGKHVLCEKPLTTTVEEAGELVRLARERNLRNCVCHNLRYYPMVQQMRRMREAGELGRILIVQGTYSQDWLLHDSDWNWRIDASAGGALRTMADVGTHWFDMAEHVTGLRVGELCADLQTFFPVRKKPKGSVETFVGNSSSPNEMTEVKIETEDFGSVLFHMGATRGSMTASQVSGGCKNQLRLEVFGTEASVAWNQERPNELWIGYRDQPNRVLLKNPALMDERAAMYADLPAGHSEGYDDTFKQVFRRFYASIAAPDSPVEYPEFLDGLRHMQILHAELESHRRRGWVDVPAM